MLGDRWLLSAGRRRGRVTRTHFYLFIYVEEGTWLRGDCDDWLILPGEDEVVAVLMKGIVIPPTNILL